MKKKRPVVLFTMAFALSLTILATVSGSTSVRQSFFMCNQGFWYQARNSGDVQINVCTRANGSEQGNVRFEIKYNGLSIASGGCNIGPCSNPTVGGIHDSSYIILRFMPSYISGIQVIEPDSNGNAQQVWIPYPYQYSYPTVTNCDPYYQFCYTPRDPSYCGSYQSQDCSAVVFRIAATPITINVFFTISPYG